LGVVFLLFTGKFGFDETVGGEGEGKEGREGGPDDGKDRKRRIGGKRKFTHGGSAWVEVVWVEGGGEERREASTE
jgi:hypothetical protein